MGKKTAGRYGKLSPSFSSLKSEVARSGNLFTDPSFPPNYGSLYVNPSAPEHPKNVVWKRPGELCADPRLFVKGSVLSDVSHKNLANAWFVTACTALASERTLWMKVATSLSFLLPVEGYTEFKGAEKACTNGTRQVGFKAPMSTWAPIFQE